MGAAAKRVRRPKWPLVADPCPNLRPSVNVDAKLNQVADPSCPRKFERGNASAASASSCLPCRPAASLTRASRACGSMRPAPACLPSDTVGQVFGTRKSPPIHGRELYSATDGARLPCRLAALAAPAYGRSQGQFKELFHLNVLRIAPRIVPSRLVCGRKPVPLRGVRT